MSTNEAQSSVAKSLKTQNALFLAAGAAASVASALFASRGDYIASAISAAAIIAALATVAFKITTETLLIIWFVSTPIASFYGRIPLDRSLVTFNRAFLVFVLLAVAAREVKSKEVRFKASTFEIAWAVLCLIAILNAGLMSDDPASATRLVVD